MKRERDTRGGPSQPSATKVDGLAPGKRTLVESAYGDHVASEAAKGGTDKKARPVSPSVATTAIESSQDAGGSHADGADQATAGAGPAQPAEPSHGASASASAAPSAAPPSPPSSARPAAKRERVVPRIDLGGSGVTSAPTSTHAHDTAHETKQQRVAATGAPTFNAAAGSNDCTPGTVSGTSVTWTVIESPTTWGVNITGFTTGGIINVAPWPNRPGDTKYRKSCRWWQYH